MKNKFFTAKAKPIAWSSKNHGCDFYEAIARKRNYKAVVHDIDGDLFRYYIFETSTGQDIEVMYMESCNFGYDIYRRCEQLLRSYAKGRTPGLTAKELELLEISDARHDPTKTNFIPFPTDAAT